MTGLTKNVGENSDVTPTSLVSVGGKDDAVAVITEPTDKPVDAGISTENSCALSPVIVSPWITLSNDTAPAIPEVEIVFINPVKESR